MPGTSRVARTIAGTVVTSSSSMIRGLVSAMYARIVSPCASAGRVGLDVRWRLVGAGAGTLATAAVRAS